MYGPAPKLDHDIECGPIIKHAACVPVQVKAKIPNPKDLEGKLAQGGAHSQVCCKTNAKTKTKTMHSQVPQECMFTDSSRDVLIYKMKCYTPRNGRKS